MLRLAEFGFQDGVEIAGAGGGLKARGGRGKGACYSMTDVAGFGLWSDVEFDGFGCATFAFASRLLLAGPTARIRLKSRNGDPVLGLGAAAVGRPVSDSLDQPGSVQRAQRSDHGSLGASGYVGEVVQG
jgi:hypothetical protein